MRRASLRIALALAGAVAAGALVAGPSSAAPTIEKKGCQIIVSLPGDKTVAVPICSNGPPL